MRYRVSDKDNILTLVCLDELELGQLLEQRAVELRPYYNKGENSDALAFHQAGEPGDDPEAWINGFLSNAFFVRKEGAKIELLSDKPLSAWFGEQDPGIGTFGKCETLSWLAEIERRNRMWEEFWSVLRALRKPRDIGAHLGLKLFNEAPFGSWADRILRLEDKPHEEFRSRVDWLLDPFYPLDFSSLIETGAFKGMIACCSCGIPDCISDYAWFMDYRCLLLLRVSAADVYEASLFPERIPELMDD